MSSRRQVWETLAGLLRRLEDDLAAQEDKRATGAAGHDAVPLDGLLEPLEKELRRLGKTQFKTNALTENQLLQLEENLNKLQQAQEKQADLQEQLIQQRTAKARHELLESFLPALDGLDHAIQSGQRYLRRRDAAAQSAQLKPEQAYLVSPADRAALSGWLEGLRLVRERMLAILEAGGVTPIPTVGRPFDPYLHTVVGTTAPNDNALPGMIVAEERRGYQTSAGVLRFAEVVVARNKEEDKS